MPGLLKMFLLQKKNIIQKGLRYFTAKEFLVKQINTEYSGDISQLKLEND